MPQADRLLLRSSASEDTTPEMGIILGRALAMDYRRVVIARDMMRSSTMMRDALVSGLMSAGADVIDLGRTSAPVVAHSAKMGDCAVYITEFREFGIISGYILLNPDGGLFRIEQIRHLQKIFFNDTATTESIGNLVRYDGAVDDYNRALRAGYGSRKTSASVVMDCDCGTASVSAPQVLAYMGADLVCLNAQKDMYYASRSDPSSGTALRNLGKFLEEIHGYVGVTINRVGTMFTFLDEHGRKIDTDHVAALMVAYLNPAKVVVPLEMTSLIDDVFYGRVDLGMETPFETGEEREIVKVNSNAGAVCDAIANSGAEIGFYDGGVIFSQLSNMSDGICAAVMLAQMAGDNMISNIVDRMPEYYTDSHTAHYECGYDRFARALEDKVQKIGGKVTNEGHEWRVDLEGGWFLLRIHDDEEKSVEVIAESPDRAYLVGLMEIATNLVDRCAVGQ